MRILFAFDKFKDSMSAQEACDAARIGAREASTQAEIDTAPISDGGEGFASILTDARAGQKVYFRVQGPREEAVEAFVGLVERERLSPALEAMLQLGDATEKGPIGIVEMASASGLQMLFPDQRDPWRSSSVGTGQLMREAIAHGCGALLLGVGGSATNDLGTGALFGLGLAFCDADGRILPSISPSQWHRIDHLSGGFSEAYPPLRIACDVENPLLGPRGATAVYGPQKGLRPEDYDALEGLCAEMSGRMLNYFGQPTSLREEPGSGAAGGLGFGLRAALPDARFVPGFDLVASWLDLDPRIAEADLVVTGEGRFDRGSLEGKGPGNVIRRALRAGKPVHVVAGAFAADTGEYLPPGLDPECLHAISPPDLPLEEALGQGRRNLTETVRRLVEREAERLP